MTWFIVQLVAVLLSAILTIVWVNWEAIMNWRDDRQISKHSPGTLNRRLNARWIRGRV